MENQKIFPFTIMTFSTDLIHADDIRNRVSDVVTPINISTTFRYDEDPEKLVPISELKEGYPEDTIIYSRLQHPNSLRLETVFDKIFEGKHTVIYNSGLSAFYGLMTHFNPKQVAIGPCYHGVLKIVDIHNRNFGTKILSYSEEDLDQLQPGDLIHIETPVNPLGLSKDIKYFAEKAHAKGALLSVDATFAPPPLQDPFQFGADIVVHSATKFFGGHSDLLAGLLVVKSIEDRKKLIDDRVYLGSNIANLESYLLLRSLRSYELRILKQSSNCLKVVTYLNENKSRFKSLAKIYHSSLQSEPFVKKQLVGGYGPVFSIELDTKEHAKYFPSKLKYFHHATSLGGVESLIEWRAITDEHVKHTLLRVSIGIEDPNDLIADLEQALLSFN